MNRGAFFAILFLSLPLRAEAQGDWNQGLAGNVYASAFTFMAPRTLDVIPLDELTLWGLRGLTALDPSVGPAMQNNAVDLIDREQVVLSMPQPGPDDAAGWGALAAQLCGRAAQLSPAIAEAGTDGIVTSFFDELFNHLDPYSRYIPSARGEADTTTGDPGLTISVAGHHAVVGAINPGGSASAAGLSVGDRVFAIDGVPTHGEDAYSLNAALAGPPGSEVTLRVLPWHERPQTMALMRTEVPPPTVFATRQGPMLVIQIAGFESGTADAFRRALTQALGAGPGTKGLVLDLRGNRGGLLAQAVAVAGSLIDNRTIGSAVGRNPEADQTWRAAADGDLIPGQPVVVLVDGRTASAAEVLAAALADDGRGVVVGSATFGKGLVQAATPLPDGGTLLVTWARLLAPLGWPLQGLGVMPQVCTSGTADSVEAALEALSGGQQPMGGALRAARAARPGITLDQILQIRGACPAALGSALDMQAAQFLVTTPPAYTAALITGL